MVEEDSSLGFGTLRTRNVVTVFCCIFLFFFFQPLLSFLSQTPLNCCTSILSPSGLVSTTWGAESHFSASKSAAATGAAASPDAAAKASTTAAPPPPAKIRSCWYIRWADPIWILDIPVLLINEICNRPHSQTLFGSDWISQLDYWSRPFQRQPLK